jgi:ABC-type transport system involved in cytochrome c biogenesis permease component
METVIFGWFLVMAMGAYLLPSFIAGWRKHPQQWAIFMLNLLLGWTFLGWAAAMIWSFTASARA